MPGNPRIKSSALPAGRVGRLFRLGRLAAGIATGALQQGAVQLAKGERPSVGELLLNPPNAGRLGAELARMRGAVMKIGQLLSMEAGDILPRELTDILAGLRDRADSMPDAELEATLARAWGTDWRGRFAAFDPQPFAAASIGQVHAATDLAGRRLAIKVQYPRVAASIDSDIANVAVLLKLAKLLPPGFDLDPLLEIARRQLHDEADYELEARYLRLYRQRLGADGVFRVPAVIDELSGPEILAMTLIDGESIDCLADAPPGVRDHLAARLIDLCLREFLQWGLVQSDPNFSNFLFDARSNTIGLLDFGALRINGDGRNRVLARLLRAALDRDLAAIVAAACEVGYVAPSDPFNDRMAIADLVQAAAEPALYPGKYRFGDSRLPQTLADKLLYLRDRLGYRRIPPADVLFLHRKLAGIFLLCARIDARVDVHAIVNAYLERDADAERRAAV